MKRDSQLATCAITCFLLSILITTVGCNNSGETADSSDESTYQPETEGDAPSETAVVKPSDMDARSPASSSMNSTTDTSPEAIVEQFIVALNEGNNGAAEKLLTQSAKVATRQHNLVVQQPWSPTAEYSIEYVRYATTRSQRAEVDSTWKDSDNQDSSESFTIVWMLYREANSGWRISGMKSDFIPNGEMVYLNFEDPMDMMARWEEALLNADERSEAIRNASHADGDLR